MRIAWVSPLPPACSGIADYSAELLPELAREVDLTLFPPAPYDPSCLPEFSFSPLSTLPDQAKDFDLILYHLGNNPYHVEIYNLARRLPGAIVLHDYVLHNLVARCTIQAGDLAGYIWHLAYECGSAGASAALRRWYGVFSEREQFLTPLNRFILDRCLGVLVHSRWVEERIEQNHTNMVVRQVPHHLAHAPLPQRQAARRQLGIAPDEIVLASFGFISAHKRIGCLLQAYALLCQEHPQVRCFLVGKPEPGLDIEQILHTMGLTDQVLITGYVDLEEFYTYIAACDIAVNLRYPSAGETSGALIRLLGSGKAVIISNVQQFANWRDSVCLKVDVGPSEEAMLLYYLRRLIEQPELRRQLGENARRYVAKHHDMQLSVRGYVAFLEDVAKQVRRGR
jgi:glycosyltransferase involved in cell wall biosynthesis